MWKKESRQVDAGFMQLHHSCLFVLLIWHSFPSKGKPPSRSKKALLNFGGNTNKVRAISLQYRKLRSRALAFSMQLSNRQWRNYCDFEAAGRPLNRQLGSESKERPSSNVQQSNNGGFLGNCLGRAVGGMSKEKTRSGEEGRNTKHPISTNSD